MDRLKRIPFYTFLLAVFFCLHGIADNFAFVSFRDAVKPGLQVLLVLVILFVITFLFSKKERYAGLVAFFICTWYFFFGAIKDSLDVVPFLGRYSVLLPLLLAATLFVILFFAKKNGWLPRVTLFLNVLLICYCGYDAGVIAVKMAKAKEASFSTNISFNAAAVKDRPNVYFLLFDEYAGYESLEQQFGFKNDLFYANLRAKGFSFIHTFSNYHYTSFSMSSLLNMNYLPVLEVPGKVTWQDAEKRKLEVKNALVFQYFKKAGYKTRAFSVFDAGSDRMIGGNTFMKGHEYIFTQKILHNRLLKVFGWSLGTSVSNIPFMHEFDPRDLEGYNEKVAGALLESVRDKTTSPRFIYAHFLLPHHPYLYDSTGKRYNYTSDMNREAAYLSYLKYANGKISAFCDSIIGADPAAIVILMSDHGYRDMTHTLGSKPSYFNNICAVRNLPLPQKNFSNVNFFRYFFNVQFGQQFSFLPDSTVMLSDRYHIPGDY